MNNTFYDRLAAFMTGYIFHNGPVVCGECNVSDLNHFVEKITDIHMGVGTRQPRSTYELLGELRQFLALKDGEEIPEGCKFPQNWTFEEGEIVSDVLRSREVMRRYPGNREPAPGVYGESGEHPDAYTDTTEGLSNNHPAVKDFVAVFEGPHEDVKEETLVVSDAITRAQEASRSLDMGDRQALGAGPNEPV